MDITRGRSVIKFLLTAVFFVIGYLIYQYVVYYHDPAKILKDHAMTTGKLVRFNEGRDQGQVNLLYNAMYVYEIDGLTYDRPFVGATACNYDDSNQLKEMLDYEYPIIYYRPDPEYSRMLITPENFENFEKEFPQSQNAIYQKFWNCK